MDYSVGKRFKVVGNCGLHGKHFIPKGTVVKVCDDVAAFAYDDAILVSFDGRLWVVPYADIRPVQNGFASFVRKMEGKDK